MINKRKLYMPFKKIEDEVLACAFKQIDNRT